MDKKVKISTNWCLLRGKNIDDTLVINLCDNKQNERPDLDDIVSFEQSIHLQQISCPPSDVIEEENKTSSQDYEYSASACEIQFQVFPKLIANSLTLITDCQKAEIFINFQKEYYQTCYGDFLDDFDGMQVYRFDIDVKEFSSFITLKMIPKIPEIWIYGMQINLKPNPNHFTMMNPAPCINIENVQSILSNSTQKLSPSAERCKVFVENCMVGNGVNSNFVLPQNLQSIMSFFNGNTIGHSMSNEQKVQGREDINLDDLSLNANGEIKEDKKDNYSSNITLINEIKNYFDQRIADMESRICVKLEAAEQRQHEKLDKILDLVLQIKN